LEQVAVLRTDLPIMERGVPSASRSGLYSQPSGPDDSKVAPGTPPTVEELKAMNFTQWLQWWLTCPESADQRTRMITDEQYFALLDAHTPGTSISSMDVNEEMKKWLYHKRSSRQFAVFNAVYHPGAGQSSQLNPILVYYPSSGKKRKVGDGSYRRVISMSQVETALHHVHESSTGHRGQETTTVQVFSVYHGIPRLLIREYVSRCSVCQQKRPKQYKPALQPIVTKAMFERLLIDLIDYSHSPDGLFRYIAHLADHRTRFHWAEALQDKTAASVARFLIRVLATTGGGLILQSDNGPEFKGEVSAVCEQFRVKQVFSSPYHPQTNGLIEKGNDSLKMMIAKRQTQHHTNGWAEGIELSILQLNTTYSRVIGMTPYELMYGFKYRTEATFVIDPWYLREVDEKESSHATALRPLRTEAEMRLLQQHSFNQSAPLKAIKPLTGYDAYVAAVGTGLPHDERLRDLPFGESGDVGRLTTVKLCIGRLSWKRFGVIGDGRCSIAAVVLAINNCVWFEDKSFSERSSLLQDHCDRLRAELRQMVVKWRPADKAKWLQAMIDCGAYAAASAKQTTSQAQEVGYQRLLTDLSDASCSMGWEIFVLLHINFRVNIFILPFTSTNSVSSSDDIHERPDGEEQEQPEQMSSDFTIIPSRIDDSLPSVVILHRAHVNVVTDDNLHEEDIESGGHYEVLFVSEARGERTSKIPLEHPAHSLLRRIGRDRVAETVMNRSRKKMEEQYNRNIKVREFKEGEAVGVRTNTIQKGRAKKPRAHNLPALVIGVVQRDGGTHQPLYHCLTQYGRIKPLLQASDLVDITEGNHKDVYTDLRTKWMEAKAEKRSMTSFFGITLETARSLAILERSPKASPPRRQQPTRIDPIAQAAAGEVTRAAAQHMVRIIRERSTQYQIEWSLPDSNPERTWESKQRIDSRAEYKDMVLEWRARHVVIDDDGDTDSEPPRNLVDSADSESGASEEGEFDEDEDLDQEDEWGDDDVDEVDDVDMED
jgi:transposase InsO family protein